MQLSQPECEISDAYSEAVQIFHIKVSHSLEIMKGLSGIISCQWNANSRK